MENLLIKCTKRQSIKARIAELEEELKQIDEDIKGMVNEGKTVCKPFTIWYRKNQTKNRFNQSKAKGFLTEEELKECTDPEIYDFFRIN